MAGIGFAINKIVKEQSYKSKIRAFSYASIVTLVPLILGEMVLIAAYALAEVAKFHITDRNLMVAIMTYGMLASMLFNGLSAPVISRFVSDKLFQKDLSHLLTVFWGSQISLVLFGASIYGIFILISGIGFGYGLLAWLLFCELLLSWNAMNFLTVLKDYLGIMKAFGLTIVITLLMGALFLLIKLPAVMAVLCGIVMGYAGFNLLAAILLYRHFPQEIHWEHFFDFLTYFDDFWQLALGGFLTQVGLIGHIVVIWFSPIGQQVKGLFYIAPYYDLTVFLASLTMLATTISFIVSLEVDFYKAYRHYYTSFSRGASLTQLRQAEKEMMDCLNSGLKRTVWIQLLVTLVMISIGTVVLSALPLGFNNTINGYFRILCVSYAVYGIANVINLSSQYFGNMTGSFKGALLFASSTLLATLFFLLANPVFFGFGFLIGNALYFMMMWLQMEDLNHRVLYQFLGKVPLVEEEKNGFFHHLAQRLNQKVGEVHRAKCAK
ncbi:exopolysaccharide Pel transporter PelG [Streptococcus loxodontisalivarius]|uniref:Membrane protein n=1 Tax=Streptococcus loxodontisalivarius TaxID=1349415 RepID=A0ABS2PSJ0_9STRE|nr:exopolysaccharide Pel transporter PelG [Streptococcus loxodontisalivarius]MBM7642965.1 putative membrane protein [Streptococcus loxodontisalivarius]